MNPYLEEIPRDEVVLGTADELGTVELRLEVEPWLDEGLPLAKESMKSGISHRNSIRM